MDTDDYLKRITNYIFDSRFTRALLIDGNWGCGKSYFVKNKLIPEIEKTAVEQRETQKKEKDINYNALLVSLYGVSTIEAIQSQMFAALLDKSIVRAHDDKKRLALKNGLLFGIDALFGAGGHFILGESAKKLDTQLKDRFLSAKREHIVLIFDDIERCQVDTIELMGYLNNLCENQGYRVILVANEGEIERKENEIAVAIQKQTALLDLYGKGAAKLCDNHASTHRDNNPSVIGELQKHRNEKEEPEFRRILDRHMEELFDHNTLYERTREKLIGLTVRFESSIEEVYDVIADGIVSTEIKEYLIQQKPVIIAAFSEAEHQNLRTLISVFIAIESMVGKLQAELSCELEEKCTQLSIDPAGIIEEEKQRVLIYLVRTAIQKAEGKAPYPWKDTRFGFIRSGYTVNGSVLGYAFMDEYWATLIVDCTTMNRDYSNRVTELLENEIHKKQNEDYYNLSLFKLSRWYMDSDSEVKEKIRQLKEDLRAKKYHPQEFKDIICFLLRLNYSGFGMRLQADDSSDSKQVFDALEDTIRTADYSAEEIGGFGYTAWKKEDTHEYVNLMLAYFEDETFEMDKEMLRVLSSDGNFVKEYQSCIQPILDRIEEKEIRKLKISDGETVLFDDQGAGLLGTFQSNRETYITKKRFLSLYGFEQLNSFILRTNAEGIFNLSDAIHSVYNFSNLRDFFESDYEVVDALWNALKDDRENDRSVYNPGRSRTREIALRKIESEFLKYKNAIQDPYAND